VTSVIIHGHTLAPSISSPYCCY